MKRFLPVYVAFFAVTLLSVYSCEGNNAKTSENTIVGTWQLKQQFVNNEDGKSLEEFPLSSCEKGTTLQVLKWGRFVETSYYDGYGIGGECLKDTEETKGTWIKDKNKTYNFLYDKSNTIAFSSSKVSIEDNNTLVITITYDDRDHDYESTLKFIYTKI
ncbi:hypothetical protein [Aquimarina algicola]|uniref:Lipocalin-like domain-containing protein n=1 Tax=Aquimarina algicola TaxID=2589995 RepID=A0A504JGX6_9FLAO|nr:hypothetical protein [Aquimarina algicola]TPN87942.1 hypothetical protein FHK87_10235 [Aquimarina algicola]